MWQITLTNQHHEQIDLGSFDGTAAQAIAEADKRAEKYSDKSGLKVMQVVCESA